MGYVTVEGTKKRTAKQIFEELEKNQNVCVNSTGTKRLHEGLISVNWKTYQKIKRKFVKGADEKENQGKVKPSYNDLDYEAGDPFRKEKGAGEK